MARARPRSRGSRRGNSIKNILAGVGVGLLSVALLGGFAYLKFGREERPRLAAETLCPVDGPRSVTVVLFDVSDDIPDVAKREVLTFLQDTADTLPEYGLLELRILTPGTPGGRVAFSKCNPGDGSNLSELEANPEMARRRWAAGFRDPLRVALETGMAASATTTSPIMATIQSVAVDRFTGRSVEDKPKRLIVVSDMIEHGPQYSQYKGNLDHAAFKALPAARALATDLHGAAVTIRYIQRADFKGSSGAHIKFWQDWVADNGGELVDAAKLQGM